MQLCKEIFQLAVLRVFCCIVQGCRSVPRLQAIWRLLLQLQVEEGAEWSQVENWRLLPVLDHALIKIQHRNTVFAKSTFLPQAGVSLLLLLPLQNV